jgi:UDP-N-acetylglucosamine diphosphorylase / glucose-1-phosphate thymidylyltransferase / UDP-N-acetylgalactosamine diphosphorylase / glucosamine-1-phosphate N-acetyltransferase / galactosamine-1-phosphate N-acetyltransferase
MLISNFIRSFSQSALQPFFDLAPWTLTSQARQVVGDIVSRIGPDYSVIGDVAIHRTASVESGTILKGPAVIGPDCFVAHGAYVRDGCWLDRGCVLGPGAELKSSFLFSGSKLAHFNFVGDSVLGAGCNLEAGAIIANYRNEHGGRPIVITREGNQIDTGVSKFGALLGDRVRVGANAVIAPGAILDIGAVVPRLGLVDQG